MLRFEPVRKLVLFVMCCFGLELIYGQEFQKNLPAKVVWAVMGKDAELPCDVTPPVPTDNVKMIFWFKDTNGMPLYSLDARGGPLGEASQLAMSDDLGQRSYFIKDEEPSKARLKIQNITIQDEGLFRCRVDFENSPTRNFQVNLSLVVQPSAPRIFDAEGREIKKNSNAGPFLEDHELFLSCQVTGGRPRPSLTWWYNNTLLDSVVDSAKGSFITVNQLVIRRTPRAYKKGSIECRASSSEIAGDVTRVIPITVYLKPNKIKIVTPNDVLSIRKSQNIRCESSGSFPPAKITWFLDGRPIRKAIVTEEVTDAFTVSIIALNVESEDDGKELVCRADNSRFPGGSLEDRRQIHVAYPPKLAVKMEDGLFSPVREGTDVIFHCEALARPRPYSYSWYHDGHLVAFNQSGGVLPIDQTLTLLAVSRKMEGRYACSAINVEGESYSSAVELAIQYAPSCKKGHKTMRVGTVPYEPLVVQCHVDAIPEVVRFSWTYNTSKGVLPILGAKMQNTAATSTLHFTPATDDLDSLSCWATNDVGQQIEPCVFYIIPAETPESPKHCNIRNSSNSEIEINCIAGSDGGLHQTFVLEVSDISLPPGIPAGVTTLSDQGERFATPLYRALEERPTFRLYNLHPGREYHILIYAENAKGRSQPPVHLPNVRAVQVADGNNVPTDTTTRPDPAGNPSSKQSLTVILVGLTAAAVLLIVGIVAVACVIACRKRPAPPRPRWGNKPSEEVELSEAGFSEGFHRRSAQYRASMYALQETEERISKLVEGPDLILSPVSFAHQNTDF